MGRFYAINVVLPTTTPPAAGTTVGGLTVIGSTSTAGVPMRSWTSLTPALYDNPGALQIEFDFQEFPAATPAGLSTLTIHGPALGDMQGSLKYTGALITMSAGMSAGLPLAKPQQSGVIMNGLIFQSFGNWQGTEMTLDFVIFPAGRSVNGTLGYTQDLPGNFVLNWLKGTQLSTALQQTLQTAYPGLMVNMQIEQTYVNNADVKGRYSTLSSLAQTISKNTDGQVYIFYRNAGSILVSDFSQPPAGLSSTTPIAFTDLIGQPTWIAPNTMQMTVVLRADIQVGDVIQMPTGYQSQPGFFQTASASLPSTLKYQSTFTGQFGVIAVRQVGNFRDPSGASWATIIQGVQR